MSNIPNVNDYAIGLRVNSTIDEILTAAAIKAALDNKNKNVDIIADKKSNGIKLLERLNVEFEPISEIEPNQLKIEFPETKGKVDKVQWQQNENNIELYLTLKEGKLEEKNMKVEQLGQNYDCVILPNIEQLSELGSIAEQADELLKNAKLFSIGTDLKLGDEYNQDSQNNDKFTTLAEQSFVALDNGNLVNKPAAQLLLAGIMNETNHLTKDVNSTEIFLTMKKLVERGAEPGKVNNVLKDLKTNSDTQPSSKKDSDKSEN